MHFGTLGLLFSVVGFFRYVPELLNVILGNTLLVSKFDPSIQNLVQVYSVQVYTIHEILCVGTIICQIDV